jgi:type I restriction enzyme M protein
MPTSGSNSRNGIKIENANFVSRTYGTGYYVIKPPHLWTSIANMARTQDGELLDTLQKGFKFIEEESFESTFKGLFSEINLASEKLDKTYAASNAKLCTIIQKIAEGLSALSMDVDSLGDAYEYLIGQFAAGSGKKAGEFYTPQQIANILSAIVTLDSQEPRTGPRKRLESVLDFACGSGSLLLNVRNRMQKAKGTIGKIDGQEKNITTYNLARMNMLLHGVKDTEFEIFHGDTLTNDWDILRDLNPAKKPYFDAVVANPPFSYRWTPTEAMGDDVRFKNHGLAPKSAADFAFLLHGFHFLKDSGVMAIIIIDTYKTRSPETRYARCVTMKEIEKHDFSLNISRYISTAEPEPEIDLGATHKELVEIEESIQQAMKKHNKFLKELGLPPLPSINSDLPKKSKKGRFTK